MILRMFLIWGATYLFINGRDAISRKRPNKTQVPGIVGDKKTRGQECCFEVGMGCKFNSFARGVIFSYIVLKIMEEGYNESIILEVKINDIGGEIITGISTIA